MNLRRALCWPCILAGLGLLFFVQRSFAADAVTDSVGWRDACLGALALVMVLTGVFMRSLDSRVASVEEDITKTREELLGDYNRKEEARTAMADALGPIKASLTRLDEGMQAIHSRLDQLKAPHARASRDGN